MTTALEPRATSSLATNQRSEPAATPRVKLARGHIQIVHADPQAGERLLAEALGAADADALHGMLRQLVKASVSGRKPNESNLAYMISMVKSIAPQDSIEAMLVSQMVSIHMAAMRCACRLAATDNLAQQDSVSRALARLARTFAAGVEALSRHRNNHERAITVQNLSVQDGGKAIVGNVTHASVVVSPPPALETTAGQQDAVPVAPAWEYVHADEGQGADA